eukprot:TRINITY_DN1790_c1_g1_i3.p2 TRINITY_DN1790_c1_g1~~TRINITY_DN1790_c1_g1_i3.p2  ORF type:complete len:178 (+),score=33.33 TRINITY_DN1790_c1_g1_i3:807-1340(+)
MSSEMAAKSCRGLRAELAAKLLVKEALRLRGLKDDITCLVVDIIPPDHSVLPSTPKKKQNNLTSIIFGKRSANSVNKLTNELSSEGFVEKLFEEGSAILAERLKTDFPLKTSSGLYRCAVCQVDQTLSESLSINVDLCLPTSKSLEGPFLCPECRIKKDAMEGKRPIQPKISTQELL